MAIDRGRAMKRQRECTSKKEDLVRVARLLGPFLFSLMKTMMLLLDVDALLSSFTCTRFGRRVGFGTKGVNFGESCAGMVNSVLSVSRGTAFSVVWHEKYYSLSMEEKIVHFADSKTIASILDCNISYTSTRSCTEKPHTH